MSDVPIPPFARAVFLDAVGTLIEPDPPAPEVYRAAGRRHGIDLSSELIALRFREAFQLEEEEDAAKGWSVSEDREQRRWQRIVSTVFQDHAAVEEIFGELWAHFARAESWRVTEDAGEVLRQLSDRGVTLGIASNFDRRLHSVIDGRAALSPIRHRVISSEVGWRKPSPRFFQAVVRAAGCEPGGIVFVGDRRDVDYEGANAAGLHGVLFDASATKRPDVQRIRRLGELIQHV